MNPSFTRSMAAKRSLLSAVIASALKDVEEAQRKVVDIVQKLNEQGLIQMGEGDEMIE